MQKVVACFGLIYLLIAYDLSAALARKIPCTGALCTAHMSSPTSVLNSNRFVSASNPCIGKEKRVVLSSGYPLHNPCLHIARVLSPINNGNHFGDYGVRKTNYMFIAGLMASSDELLATSALLMWKTINTKDLYGHAKENFENCIARSTPSSTTALLEENQEYQKDIGAIGVHVGRALEKDIKEWIPCFMEQKEHCTGRDSADDNVSAFIRLIVAMRLRDDIAPVFDLSFAKKSHDEHLRLHRSEIVKKDVITWIQNGQIDDTVEQDCVEDMRNATRNLAYEYFPDYPYHVDVIHPSVLVACRKRLEKSLMIPEEGVKEDPCCITVKGAVEKFWDWWKYRNRMLEHQKNTSKEKNDS